MQRLNRSNNNGLISRLNRLIERRELKQAMKKVSFGLSCVAVFVAVYVLVAPALTMEYPLECGKEEHVHTEECYGTITPKTIVCNIQEESGADIILHKHNKYCYDDTGKLICTLPEIEGHTHTADCYSLVPEFDPEDGEDAQEPEEVETLPPAAEEDHENNSETEQTPSQVQDNHENTVQDPSQSQAEEPKQPAAEEKVEESHKGTTEQQEKAEPAEPKHESETEKTAKKWSRVLLASLDDIIPVSDTPICGKEELKLHTHTASCYDESGNLICGRLQVIEHQHTAACVLEGEPYEGLICGKEEHTHTDACRMGYIPENGQQVDVDEEYTLTTDQFIMTFHAKGTASLEEGVEVPEDAELSFSVTQVEDEQKSQEYEDELMADGETMGVFGLEIFSWDMSYGDCELDLSDVDVLCEVKPTEGLIEYASAAEEQGMTMFAMDDSESAEEPVSMGFMILASTPETEPKESAITEDSKLDLVLHKEKEVRVAIIQGANPSFTVQYYAPVKRVVNEMTDSKYEAIPVIDTEGGNLPKNGVTPAEKNIYVEKTNSVWTPRKVLMEEQLTEIYQKHEFAYLKAPNLKYFNVVERDTLADKSSYKLKEIWILKPDKDPESTDANDWDIYPYGSDLKFTNRSESAIGSRVICIYEGTVMRLVYDTTIKTHTNPVNFYDYNITDGNIYTSIANAWNQTDPQDTATQTSSKKWYVNTVKQGINSTENYSGTGAKLGFGNANNGTTMEKEIWNGQKMNTANTSYKKCTFGLVSGTVTEGDQEYLQYSAGVDAPKLFNEVGGADGQVVGKKSYIDQYSLVFDQEGDSYILQAVKKNSSGANVADNLASLAYCLNWSKTEKIWSNSFWPMDGAESHGTTGNDFLFGKSSLEKNRLAVASASKSTTMGTSDDNVNDHNGFFGMNFAVDFELTRDYVGPLEYYFFGDDDMWIFLNGRLVCDIGGVHGSIGEYVNLWDYIDRNELQDLPEDESKTYRLTFFYTERGTSGSTCWMQFTLPTVVGVNLMNELEEQNDADHGALWVDKTVDGFAEDDAEFNFILELFTKDPVTGEETQLPDNYSADVLVRDDVGNVIKTDKNEVLHAGSNFVLKDGGAITLYNLPVEYDGRPVYYRVTEEDEDGFTTSYSVEESIIKASVPGTGNGDAAADVYGHAYTGQITANYLDKVSFVNHASYELPETGGEGHTMYTIAGLLCLAAAASILYKKKVKASEK